MIIKSFFCCWAQEEDDNCYLVLGPTIRRKKPAEEEIPERACLSSLIFLFFVSQKLTLFGQ
jgi:hypothetical protein